MENRDFRIAVVTISDRASTGERADASGPEISACLQEEGYRTDTYIVIPDEKKILKETLLELCDVKHMDLILTTGGTGLAQRDITPETTMEIATKNVPGIAEAIRAFSLTKTPNAMLSRGVSVLRNSTLIINFAGSPKACRESMGVIAPALSHALGLLRGEKLDK